MHLRKICAVHSPLRTVELVLQLLILDVVLGLEDLASGGFDFFVTVIAVGCKVEVAMDLQEFFQSFFLLRKILEGRQRRVASNSLRSI